MFGKRASFARDEDILLLDERPNPRGSGVVDHVAIVGAFLVGGLGIAQFLAPAMAAPLTGIEHGTGSQILGLQWAILGLLLICGGLFRLRVLTIFAAEFLLVSGLAALLVTAIKQPDAVHLLVHGGVAFIGFTSSGLARLTDRAELKRDLRIAREHAQRPNGPKAGDGGRAESVERAG